MLWKKTLSICCTKADPVCSAMKPAMVMSTYDQMVLLFLFHPFPSLLFRFLLFPSVKPARSGHHFKLPQWVLAPEPAVEDCGALPTLFVYLTQENHSWKWTVADLWRHNTIKIHITVSLWQNLVGFSNRVDPLGLKSGGVWTMAIDAYAYDLCPLNDMICYQDGVIDGERECCSTVNAISVIETWVHSIPSLAWDLFILFGKLQLDLWRLAKWIGWSEPLLQSYFKNMKLSMR